jgi:hypothetical protein
LEIPGDKFLTGDKISVVILAGLIFLIFLDWLLVEWFLDFHFVPFDRANFPINRSNVSSMLFNHDLVAAIYFGFNTCRK